MLTSQQKWNRYVYAINYCIDKGIIISIEDSKGDNVKSIRCKWLTDEKEVVIHLKPKKYKPFELYRMIIEKLGFPKKIK